jgi:hypothetical protein
MLIATRCLRAMPMRWRPGVLLLLASRGWRGPLLLWAGALPLAALAARSRADLGMSLLMFVPPLAALALFGELYPHARRPAVWTTLFTRAGAGPADLWRATTAAAVLYGAVTASLGAVTLAGLRSAAPLDGADMARILTFAVAWAVICGLAATVVTATVRRGAAGVLVVWLATPAFLRALPLDERLQRILEAVAPPLEAAVRLHAAWTGMFPDLAPWFAWHLGGFLTLATVLLGARLRRIAQSPDAVE